MRIVTAAVIIKNGKILIARRKKEKLLGNKWEFPGGKLDREETPEQCLERELLEELSIVSQVGELVASTQFTFQKKKIQLLAYLVQWVSGNMTLTDHEEVRWISAEEFDQYDFVKADQRIVLKVKALMNPK